ncbi:MAG: hypothetical protein DI630_00995 [Gordonia sp. (in: high G+C Gram-positive bacteria)]|nr:MAG: hypothetical protein DI630_00995 [Gordonia sp. (in: high G+C Gram-positive bacteria)]
MTAEELDELVQDRFGFDLDTLTKALHDIPAHRPWATRLTVGEAQLLDNAGLTDDPEAYAHIAADLTAQMARLYEFSYTPNAVATGLGVTDSRVRQRRLKNTLWAIDDGGTWVYPALQFECFDNPDGTTQLKHVRGLDRVLPRLLSLGLHPVSIAGFFDAGQPELLIDGREATVKEWLLHGGPVQPVLQLIEIGEWASA